MKIKKPSYLTQKFKNKKQKTKKKTELRGWNTNKTSDSKNTFITWLY